MSADTPNEDRLTDRERELLERGRQAELVEAIRIVVRNEVQDTMRRYYGDRAPEQVLEVIRNAEQMQKRIGKLTDSFWGAALAWIFKALFFLAAVAVIGKATGTFHLPFGND